MANQLCDGGLFNMYQGDTRILHFLVKDGNGEEVDISGATSVIFALFTTDKAEVLRRTLADTVTVAGATITVVIPDTLTEDLLGQYLYEVQLTDASSYKHTVSRGTAEVVEDLIND